MRLLAYTVGLLIICPLNVMVTAEGKGRKKTSVFSKVILYLVRLAQYWQFLLALGFPVDFPYSLPGICWWAPIPVFIRPHQV